MRSRIAGLNPLVLLWVGFASLLGSFAIRDEPAAIAGVIVYAAAGLLLLPSWRYPVACLALCGVSAGLVAYSAWRLGNADHALTASLRILVLAWPGAVVVAFVDPSRLGDELAQRLHVPGRFVASFVAVLQRTADLQASWQQIARVRRARGLRRDPGAMTFSMLASSLRGAGRMAIAMDARGFAGATRRSWAEPARWTRGDTVGLVVATVLGAVPVVVALLA